MNSETLLTDAATWPTISPFLFTVNRFSEMPWLVRAQPVEPDVGSTEPAMNVLPTTY